ncbi:MAG: CPBP family intramembrane glutamic endopeptidase, partial [Planctomycetota bacterium]
VIVAVRLKLYRASPTPVEPAPGSDAAGSDALKGGDPLDTQRARLAMLREGVLPLLLLCAFLTIYTAQLLGGASGITLLGLDMTDPTLRDSALVTLAMYTCAALGIAFAVLFAPGVGRVFASGLGPSRVPRDLATGLGWFLLVMPVVVTVSMVSMQIATAIRGAPPDQLGHSTLRVLSSGDGPAWAWWLIVAGVTIGAPIVEEVLYRGCVQSAARRFLPAWGAIVATSLVFTLIHIGSADARAMPGLFVLALGMGLVYERTGRLLPCVIVHALFNATNVAVAAISVGATA